MTCGEVFKALVSWLQAKDLVPEDYMCIDYPHIAHPDPKAEWPKGRVICYCVPGHCEGYYVHVSVLQPTEGSLYGKHVPVFTGKTFRGLAFGLAIAAECATFFHEQFNPDQKESCDNDGVPGGDKVYVLARQNGEPRCTVLTPYGQYTLHHVVRHSPTGIEWGYGGSGPADLALSILIDFGVENAEDLYQAFKRDVIADIPEAGGTISATDIIAWLRGHES